MAKSHFKTAVDFLLKLTYTKDDIKNSEHLNFVAGIAPNLREP